MQPSRAVFPSANLPHTIYSSTLVNIESRDLKKGASDSHDSISAYTLLEMLRSFSLYQGNDHQRKAFGLPQTSLISYEYGVDEHAVVIIDVTKL